MKITLAIKKRDNPYIPIEAEAITTKTFLEKKPEDISVWYGNSEQKLTEIFDVRVEGDAKSEDEVTIIMSGNCSAVKRVGEYMNGGIIEIEGNIGHHCGNFMSGGLIEIRGNAESWLGREMRGGKIICHGDAQNYCGSGYRGEKKGMTGGTIEVMGSAGDFTAETLAGGEVIIRGNTGNLAGAEMIDGTLKIYGDAHLPCANMKGGTCHVYGTAYNVLPTFEYKGLIKAGDQASQMHMFNGDIANRNAKGTLYAAKYEFFK
ncbi:formylmethanofuran dehydrogenase subunit C [Methanoplanus sp. FWC-SCC4]|uniref:formylmethanofuran dehydrogenase n=1 Tax=Methanochimaera problematica TaxID=2609417 RepID=A0AA97I1M1_9EURY|nr:formylmethanofuran dehydrogenase subunit C [Methanoplanus sp. FWC-SCC4]WOF15300.1 formylmethanofuran dehydrogenase subunit C [Methanoplanus sp. FWC-SCC4]